MDRTPPTSCLIVEDQALIGMALEASLEEAGYASGLVSSSAQALIWLETLTPSCVILDYELRDGPCLPLARELQRRGVPFVIYSGHRRDPDLAELKDVPWIEKPASRTALISALVQAARPPAPLVA